jgi:formylglycine-generating enzyme required for sulfatase activity
MKRTIFVLLFAVALVLQGCGGSSKAQPTAIQLPTTAPTATPVPTNAPETNGKEARAGEERVSPVDGMIQVFIPAGSFRMGALDSKGQSDEEPDRQVSMHSYWMDKVEVTVGMYKLCVQAGACEPPKDFTSNTHDDYFSSGKYDNYPVVNVTWGDAKAYCEWAGRRLPTEAEWEYAARGTDFRTYPWGDERPDSSRANFNYQANDTTPVGSFPAGASAFGLLDMAGNVWEWTNDYYDPNYYQLGPAQSPKGPIAPAAGQGQRRVIRGGSWADGERELRVANRGFALGPDEEAELNSPAYFGEHSNRIGFRCAADN